MRFCFYLEGAHPDKYFQKSFWLEGKESSLVGVGMDVFGKFFIVSWLIDKATPRSPICSFFFRFSLLLVFQEMGVFQQNQLAPDNQLRHQNDHVTISLHFLNGMLSSCKVSLKQNLRFEKKCGKGSIFALNPRIK